MSTILDALKKSEQERKLNKLPTLTDIVAPQEPSRWPVFIGVALLLLAMALVVLAYVIWSARPPTESATIGRNDDAASEYHASSPNDLTNNALETQAQVTEERRSSATGDAILVNAVSYSPDPALRFAMVNGEVVREGQFISAGLKVEEIQFDTVVFNLRGETIRRRP